MDKFLELKINVGGGAESTPFPNSDNPIIIGEFRYDAKRMGGAPTITASVNYPSCLDDEWTDNVYAEFNGEKYYLKQTPTSSYDNADTMYRHDISLVSERVALDNVYFFDVVTGNPSESDKPVSNSTKVVFFGDVREFASRLQASLEYSGLGYTVVVDDDVVSEEKLMSFEDQFFSNVLQEIYNTYEVPYYFVGKTIHIGDHNKLSEDEQLPVFAYGVDDALLSITKNNANYKIVNRATGTGSSDNIPFYYPNNSPKGVIAATPSGNFEVKVLDTELYSNEIKLDGVIRKSNVEYENAKATFGGEEIYSGETFSAQLGAGGINKTFGISFASKDAGIFLLSFSSSVTKYILKEEEKTDATFGVRYFVKVYDRTAKKYTYDSKGSLSSIEDFEVQVPYANHEYSITIECYYAAEGKYAGKGGRISFNASYSFGSKSGWMYEDKVVDLKDVGLEVVGNTVTGDTITQTLVKYVNTSKFLMPFKYRETDGKERFYNATNDTYEGVTFNNPFVAGHPKEHIINVDDIKPSIEGVEYNGQRIDMFEAFAYDDDDNDETYEDEEGNVYFKHPYFFAKLKPLGFNLFDHAIEQQPMVISFTSGDCGACNFEIAVDEDTQKNTVQVDEDGNLIKDENGRVLCGIEDLQQEVDDFQDIQQDTTDHSVWIALRKEEETYGILMPKAPTKDEQGNEIGGHRPSTEDTFVILGINLPYEYIEAAEKKLEAEIIKYLQENNDEKFTFSISFSRIYFAENPDILPLLSENSKIKITYNNKEYDLYVSSYSYSMGDNDALPEIRVELDETLKVSQNALQNAISEVKSSLGSTINEVAQAVAMQKRSYVSKVEDDNAQGIINFTKGIKFGEGGKVEVMDNNSAKLTIEYLEVTKKASFTSLEIQEKTHVGGQLLVTPAAINCGEVEEFDNYYRCYFQTKGADGDEIFNQFAVGDQAICQTYNAWGSKYYWRLVAGIGEDYIDLSKTECDEDSGIPSAGDKIIQLGNQVDAERQNAIVIAAYGDGSPYIIQYKGINDFELPDDKIVTKLSSTENIFTGKVHMELGSDGLANIPEWVEVKDTANEALEKVEAMGENTFAELEAYINEVRDDLQMQIDGSIDSYFYEYEPSISNFPASEWDTTEKKEAHLNDTFTNLKDGRSWRWTKNTSNAYGWTEITDTATSEALAKAGKAQETADGKMTVFMSQPTPPYKAGDLWAGGEGQPLRRCVNTKASGSYNSSDWALADNAQAYADAIKAELELSVQNTKNTLDKAIEDAEKASKNYTDEAKTAINKSIATLEQAKANVVDVYDKTSIDGKFTTAEQNANAKAKEYADAAQELAEKNVKAWADGEIDDAEARAIAEAEAKVNAAKNELDNAIDALEKDLEAQINLAISSLNSSIETAKTESKSYTDSAKSDIDARISQVEQAKADIEDVYDKATADGKISDAEKKAIAAANAYANAQSDYLDRTLRAWADGEIDDAEANAIADAEAKVNAAKEEMERYTDEMVNGMKIGGENLLRNSGFTGDYLSEQLADEKVLEGAAELYSSPLDHWTYTNAMVVDSEESTSGKAVNLNSGTLSQSLYYKTTEGEQYALSFKAKGRGNLTYTVGDASGSVALTTTMTFYEVVVTPTTSSDTFVIRNATCTIGDLKLEKGNKATSWSASPLDNASDRAYYQSMKYIQNAFEGATNIGGGLVLTEQIQVGDYDTDKKEWVKMNGGMSGVYESDHDVAFWAGGNFNQAIETVMMYEDNPTFQPTEEQLASMAKFVVTHGGKAILNDIILRGIIYAKGGSFGDLKIGKYVNACGRADAEDSVFSELKQIVGDIVYSTVVKMSAGAISSYGSYNTPLECFMGNTVIIDADANIDKNPYKAVMYLRGGNVDAMHIEAGDIRHLSGQYKGLRTPTRVITEDYTVDPNEDSIIIADSTNNPFFVYVPTPYSILNGAFIEVHNVGNTPITLDTDDIGHIHYGGTNSTQRTLDPSKTARLVFSGARNIWYMTIV